MKTITKFKTGFFAVLLSFILSLVYSQNANALNIDAARMGGGGPDTIKPVITNPDADIFNTVKVQMGSVFVDRTMVTDNIDQPVLHISPGSDQVETGFTGIYMITYNATDFSGNKAIKTYTYIVNDYIPPVINLNTADTIAWPLNKPYTPQQAMAVDNKDGLVQVTLVISTVNTSVPGLYYDLYTAEDQRSNKSVKRRYVQVGESGQAGIAVPDQTPLISFYPNPSSGIVHISYDFNTYEPMNLEVYNMAGELVEKKSGIFGKNRILTIDLGDKTKGVYTLKVKTGHSEISRKVSIR